MIYGLIDRCVKDEYGTNPAKDAKPISWCIKRTS